MFSIFLALWEFMAPRVERKGFFDKMWAFYLFIRFDGNLYPHKLIFLVTRSHWRCAGLPAEDLSLSVAQLPGLVQLWEHLMVWGAQPQALPGSPSGRRRVLSSSYRQDLVEASQVSSFLPLLIPSFSSPSSGCCCPAAVVQDPLNAQPLSLSIHRATCYAS